MATWPAGLPAPVIADFRSQDRAAMITTPMESGPSRRTRLSAHWMTTGTMTLYLEKAQADALRTWLSDQLYDGANWIDDLPLDTGQGLAPHHARISGMSWSFSQLVPGKNWRFSCQFETDERNAPAEA